MIIISKFKDYYDFLQGTLGRDNNLILDRTLHSENEDTYLRFKEYTDKFPIRVKLIIGNTLFTYFYFKGKSYFEKENCPFIINKKNRYKRIETLFITGEKPNEVTIISKDDFCTKTVEKWQGKEQPSFIEVEFKSLEYSRYSSNLLYNKKIAFPILEKLGINTFLNPIEIWNLIYNELCKLKDSKEPENISDKEKIVNKGFDLKNSFRNTK